MIQQPHDIGRPGTTAPRPWTSVLIALGLVLGVLVLVGSDRTVAAERPDPPAACEDDGTTGTRWGERCLRSFDGISLVASIEEATFQEELPNCLPGRNAAQVGWCETFTLTVQTSYPFCETNADRDCITGLNWELRDNGYWADIEWINLSSEAMLPRCGSRTLECPYFISSDMERNVDNGRHGWLMFNGPRVGLRTDDPARPGFPLTTTYVPNAAVYVPPAPKDAPTADFSWEVPDPDRPNVVRFTNTSTEPYGSVLSTDWDFGDGDGGTGDVAVNTYLEEGFYTVTLTVQSWGTNLTDAHSVTIHVEMPEDPDPPLVVNSTGDASAEDPTEGCDTGAEIGEDPECTVRAAIETVNAGGPGGSVISFAIPAAGAQTIEPAAPLPVLTAAGATIDGSTQGAPVVIDAGESGVALSVAGDGSTLRGLTLVGTSRGVDVSAGGVTLQDLRVGVLPDGETTSPVLIGVQFESGAGSRLLDSHIVSAAQQATLVLVGTEASAVEVRGNSVGVTDDGSDALGPANVGVLSGGPGAIIEDNVVSGTVAGIAVVGESARGSVVEDNRVGAGSTAAFAGRSGGIIIDGAPDVQVRGNVVVAGADEFAKSAGIAVSGVMQARDSGSGLFLSRAGHETYGVRDGDVTGANIVIEDNTIGSLAAGVSSGDEGPDGIQLWADATDVTVRNNHVHGPSRLGMLIDDASEVTVVGNRIATGTPDTGPDLGIAIGGHDVIIGTAVSGNQIGAREAGVEIVAGSTDVEVRTNQIMTPVDAPDAACIGSNATVEVVGNLLDCGEGIVVVPPTETSPAIGEGVVIEKNTVQADTRGIQARAVDAKVVDNEVTGGATGGIEVEGVRVSVVGNEVDGAGVGIALGATDSTVKNNTVTGSTSDGVTVEYGSNVLEDNDISGSGGRGIAIDPTAVPVTLRGNRIAESTGVAIDAPGGPAAPTIDAVVMDNGGGSTRTTLVISGLPDEERRGELELFANASCADPEAEQVLGVVRELDGSTDTTVVRLVGRASTDHFTAIFTNAVNGSSSALSTCAEAIDHPDTDGDGTVDPIDDLAGTANDPTRATLVTDTEQILSLTAVGLDDAAVRFTQATVADDPNSSGHAGVEFPFGVVRFSLDGVTPGGQAAVRFVLLDGDDLPASAGYWKYGTPIGSTTPQWYPFTNDAATGTGASVLPDLVDVPGVGLRRALAVVIADGGRGDHDRLVNGRIDDPGAITATLVDQTPTDPTDPTDPTEPWEPGAPLPPAPATPTPAAPPSAPVDGMLPATGSSVIGPWLVVAVLSLLLGVAFVLPGSRSRVQRSAASTGSKSSSSRTAK